MKVGGRASVYVIGASAGAAIGIAIFTIVMLGNLWGYTLGETRFVFLLDSLGVF